MTSFDFKNYSDSETETKVYNESESNDDPFASLNDDDTKAQEFLESDTDNDYDITNNLSRNNDIKMNDIDTEDEMMDKQEQTNQLLYNKRSWMDNNYVGLFGERTLVIYNIPISFNEKMILKLLFDDSVSDDYKPNDIRLYFNRHKILNIFNSNNDNNANYKHTGYCHLIFNDKSILDKILPLIKDKNSVNKQKFDLVQNLKLNDFIESHYIRNDLYGSTFRLIGVNISYKTKAINVYNFIKNELIKNKTKDYQKYLPVKIQILETEYGFNTYKCFIDFNDNTIANEVLFLCHKKMLNNRIIYLDWHHCSHKFIFNKIINIYSFSFI